MKLNRSFSFVVAVALLFCAFAFASPPVAAAKTTVKTETAAKNVFTVAVGFSDTVKTVAPSAPTNSANTLTAPPVALPAGIEQSIVRQFNGYVNSRNDGKIPIRRLNINAAGRAEPDYVPLN